MTSGVPHYHYWWHFIINIKQLSVPHWVTSHDRLLHHKMLEDRCSKYNFTDCYKRQNTGRDGWWMIVITELKISSVLAAWRVKVDVEYVELMFTESDEREWCNLRVLVSLSISLSASHLSPPTSHLSQLWVLSTVMLTLETDWPVCRTDWLTDCVEGPETTDRHSRSLTVSHTVTQCNSLTWRVQGCSLTWLTSLFTLAYNTAVLLSGKYPDYFYIQYSPLHPTLHSTPLSTFTIPCPVLSWPGHHTI